LMFAVSSLASATPEINAQKAAESWLALVDSGQYGKSWEQASNLFRSRIEKNRWVKTLTAVRSSLGNVQSRKLRNATFVTSLPGAPDGKYVVLHFDTSFSKKKAGVETITPMEEDDGQWRVSGYFIK